MIPPGLSTRTPTAEPEAGRSARPIRQDARRRPRCGLGQAVFILLWLSSSAWAQPVGESVLKAAFLYNFAKFVEWPEQALSHESEPFTICLIGEPRMAEATNEFIKDKQVHGRMVVSRAVASVADVRGCHLLFVDASAQHVEELMTNGSTALPMLTVGESDQFLAQGGMIKLFVDHGKMRFAISPRAAERAQLKISSKLLTLGTIAGAP